MVIVSVSVTSFAYIGDTSATGATITVTAMSTTALTLSIRYLGLGADGGEHEGVGPVIETFPLSGQTTYTVTSTAFDAAAHPCFSVAKIKTIATAG